MGLCGSFRLRLSRRSLAVLPALLARRYSLATITRLCSLLAALLGLCSGFAQPIEPEAFLALGGEPFAPFGDDRIGRSCSRAVRAEKAGQASGFCAEQT